MTKDLAADVFQDQAGMINYLTIENASSTYQGIGNYITTFSPLAGTYLTILNAQNTYQTPENMATYVTSGTLINCILYNSDDADELRGVELGGIRIIKKKISYKKRRK